MNVPQYEHFWNSSSQIFTAKLFKRASEKYIESVSFFQAVFYDDLATVFDKQSTCSYDPFLQLKNNGWILL